MSSAATARIIVDKESMEWIDELVQHLSILDELVPRPVELVELVRSTPRGATTFSFKSLPTGRASEHRIVLEPSKALLSLMAALRTFDGGRHFINETCHITHSS